VHDLKHTCGQSGGGSEPNRELTRDSHRNGAAVGRVTRKDPEIIGGKGGTRTLDPGIMSGVEFPEELFARASL
jgi:hypothetical protein